MKRTTLALDHIRSLGPILDRSGAVLSGEAAAHLHLAAASGTEPGAPPRYSALPLRSIRVLSPGETGIPGVETDRGPVADVLLGRLDLFATRVTLGDGTPIRTLTREAVVAQLLAEGGLVLGLIGTLLCVAGEPAIDPDDVREILKAARQGDRFQPLLELMAVL